MNVKRVVLAIAVVAASGCTTEDLDLFVDTRVEITAPAEASHVRNPVTVTWTADDDLRIVEPGSGDDGVYFVVFDGSAPLRPGAPLISLADSQCRKTPGCATRPYFAERDVYVTGDLAYTFDRLDEGEEHDLTIVLMDGRTDTRSGEALFHVAFFVDEPLTPRELRPEDVES